MPAHLPACAALLLGAVVALGAATTPRHGLVNNKPDTIQKSVELISKLTAQRIRPRLGSVGPTWADCDHEAQYAELHEYLLQHDLIRVGIMYSLAQSRETSIRYREYAYVALHLWAHTPWLDDLRHDGELFLDLLKKTRSSLHGKSNLLWDVAEALSPTALSFTDDHGRTPLECYLGFSFKNEEASTMVAISLAQKTPPELLDPLMIATRERLPPHIWTQVFYNHIRLVQTKPQFVESEALYMHIFGDHIDGTRWKLEVLLSTIRQLDAEYADDHVRSMIEHIDLDDMLDNLQGHFNYILNDVDLEAIWHLSVLYEHADVQDVFLKSAPTMFALVQNSYNVIHKFIEKIFFGGHHDDNWRKRVLFALLKFHLDYDEIIAFHLVNDFVGDKRYMLIEGLARTLGSKVRMPKRVTQQERHRLVLLYALNVCSSVRDDEELRAWSSLVLSLTLRMIMERQDLVLILQNVPEFDDHQLQLALTSFAMFSDFHICMDMIGEHSPDLYLRIKDMIPDRCVKPDHNPVPYLPFLDRMFVRAGTDASQDYELIERLGAGAFATVYRGRCLRGPSTHEVAIKVMESGDFETDREIEFMSRFCQSGEQPGLVRVLDLVQYGLDTYIVMEVIDGHTVQNWLAPSSAQAAFDDLVRRTYEIVVILHHLHRAGWSHGDIQHLNNFMIDTATGNVVVLDFGMVRPLDQIGCGRDLDQLHMHLMTLMHETKLSLGYDWYQEAPYPLSLLESALLRWRKSTWDCAVLLEDPIFDSVHDRDVPGRHPPQYLDYPDMIKEQAIAELAEDWAIHVEAELRAELKTTLVSEVKAELKVELLAQVWDELKVELYDEAKAELAVWKSDRVTADLDLAVESGGLSQQPQAVVQGEDRSGTTWTAMSQTKESNESMQVLATEAQIRRQDGQEFTKGFCIAFVIMTCSLIAAAVIFLYLSEGPKLLKELASPSRSIVS